MKHYLILVLALTLLLPSCKQVEEEKVETLTAASTFYFIRHAEKDRSDANNRDPKLMTEGLERAQKWREVLSNVKFDAIYSTDYNRTKETAQPTADANNLELVSYDPSNLDGVAFLETNRGKNVLVVGHSNTTPMFVNAILDSEKYPKMEDDNNANLYILTVSGSGEIVDVLLKID